MAHGNIFQSHAAAVLQQNDARPPLDGLAVPHGIDIPGKPAVGATVDFTAATDTHILRIESIKKGPVGALCLAQRDRLGKIIAVFADDQLGARRQPQAGI
ncbi:hypothetical protein SB00610_04109 [Klebsiella quasipneumoniae subsp. similipneumoniae]|nr:hypothetical protein SB00610_04109 [Klebsiella quasipneumoniae subsp. similipneumoniae]